LRIVCRLCASRVTRESPLNLPSLRPGPKDGRRISRFALNQRQLAAGG
jgi:hypothetical protein